ncbi:MAG: hypothetical protein ABIX01_04600 [Chitinophagaceae bacterium]
MKILLHAWLLIVFVSEVKNCPAQNIKIGTAENPKKIDGLKDGYGVDINYVGEIKNGKPSGKGLAIYKNNPTQKYFGEFENGLYNGKGSLIYSDGRISTGNFKDGKLFGTAVFIGKDGSLLWGNYGKDNWEGATKKIGADNKFRIENSTNGLLSGRVIEVPENGKFIYDHQYVDGKWNGQGYQYELENKKLFEGIYKDNVWLEASTGNYPSFLRSSKFQGYMDADKIIMNSNYSTEKNLLEDTCYAFVKANNIRMFGNFHLGNLTNGMKTIGDSNKMMGEFDTTGLTGTCVDYKVGSRLVFGNFKHNMIDGQGVFINTETKEIYDGIFTETKFTGKASKLTYKNVLELGSFFDDKLDGNTTIIKPNGAWMKGEYSYGSIFDKKIKQVGLPNGLLINPQPANINTALNDLIKIAKTGFDDIASTDSVDEEENFAYSLTNDKDAWYNFPGSSANHIEEDLIFESNYYADIENIKDFDLLNKQYDDMCDQILAANITSFEKGKAYKYIGKIQPLSAEFKTEQKVVFDLNNPQTTNTLKPSITVTVSKKEGGDYYHLEFKMNGGHTL